MLEQRQRVAVLLAAIVILGWSGGAAAADIATLVKTGDVAPGTGGATFSDLTDPVVNGAGEVAFRATLTGSGVTEANDEGIWIGKPGGFALVAREGDPAPGAGGAGFDGFIEDPVISGAGEVAFRAKLMGSGVTPDVNDLGLWAGKLGALVLAARLGDPAPGAGGAVLESFRGDTPVLNGAGELAFRARLTGSGVTAVNDEGLWVGRPTSLVLAVREGDPAPGVGGALFDGGFGSPVLNGAGDLALRARLRGSGVAPENNFGIWVGKPGGLALVIRSGDPAPGAGGSDFRIFSSPVLNGAGELAFQARLTRGKGIWAGHQGRLALVAIKWATAPGAGGARFGGRIGDPVVNGAGELAFRAQLKKTARLTGKKWGVWTGAPGALTLVARQGDRAPGTVSKVFDDFAAPTLNGAGEVAIHAFLTRGTGLWAGAPSGLQLVARQRSEIEVEPGLFKTVRSLALAVASGNEDGRSSSFSEAGQLAFRASFTDGSSGVFLSPPDAPEVHHMPHRAIDGAWNEVILPRSFGKPVIIAGPPTSGDMEPGAVRLRQIDGAAGRFEARFQEWDYLDGVHPEERTDFLVMNQGRKRQADGSIWEAGTIALDGNRNWARQRFKKAFPGVPEVFLTVQSDGDSPAVAARARGVTKRGFEVSIQEQEQDLAGGHGEETVGYLAVYSKKGKGKITGGVRGTRYRLKQADVGDSFKRVLGERIKLEEEKSKDKETKHKKETVSVMSLGRGLFAQQASDKECDTTAIRRR